MWCHVLNPQVLAAFLKCIGHIIPLMDAVYANYYTREVMFILVREFQTPDEEMKKIVLKVVHQCVGTEGVEPDYIRTDILGPFFANFWVRRMALDRRNYRQLVETTVALANKVCVPPLLVAACRRGIAGPILKLVKEALGTADCVILPADSSFHDAASTRGHSRGVTAQWGDRKSRRHHSLQLLSSAHQPSRLSHVCGLLASTTSDVGA